MDEELLKLKGDHHMKNSEIIKRSFGYVKSELPLIIVSLLMILVNVALSSLLPVIFQQFIDTLEDTTNVILRDIIFLAVGYFVINVFNQAFLYFESMILQKVGQKIIYSLRVEVFKHIENMSLNQFNDMPVGSLVTRVANYTSAMSTLFTDTLVNLIKNILMICATYAIMAYYSWKLSLIMLAIIAIIFVATFIFQHYIGLNFKKERAYVSDMNTFLSENLAGMKIIQLFNQEKRKKDEFFSKNETLRKQRYKMVILFAIYRPFVSFMTYAAVALTFFMGLKFNLSSGEVVAFYISLFNFFEPVQALADQFNNLQSARSASERLFNLLDVKPDVLDKPDAKEIEHFKGKIEFKNVWFAYEKDNYILKDVSFIVEPGKTCAFVGATGAGKTTILSLIVRNYNIQKGQILIDDIDINDIKIESLRKHIGQMLQDVFLFSGTIRSNITLKDDSFSDEEIKKTCKYVNADTFIDKLDKGLDSEVIEKGENFSQGQRQLLSFARTVLHKPNILILDEATANIDTETERIIQDSLNKIKNIGTMLVVAHRLSTIKNADKIICLQNGQIVESGTHQELLDKKGYYFNLCALQEARNN